MMKKLLVLLLTGLLIGFVAVPASAWEFSLSGTFLWGYDYFAQGGKSGFFGKYDQISPTGGAISLQPLWAAMNAWVGARTINSRQYGFVTGADASFNYQRMELYPEIRINPAIRLRGWYQIGSFNNNLGYGLYQNSSDAGAWNAIDTGSWTQWWGAAETPWGLVVAGKRPLSFGIGAQYDGTSVTSESLLLVVPYGPLRMGLGIYPHRREFFVNSFNTPGATIAIDPGGLTLLPGGTSRQVISNNSTLAATGLPSNAGAYYKQWDHTSAMVQQPIAFITYRAGPLDVGILYEYLKEHEGPEAAPRTSDHQLLNTRDSTIEDGCVYEKYNNGRFFLNSELAWTRVQTNYQLPSLLPFLPGGATALDPGDGGGSQYAPYSIEAWKFMTELGAMCGPAKISFLYSWVPGPDRRHGIWINKQSWENISVPGFPQRNLFGNAQAFLPYSLLMSYQYGAGLNATNLNGEGYMTDASSWGARLDYAVAANLNVYGSFFYATRVSKGWGWGSLVPQLDPTAGPNVHVLGTEGPTGLLALAFNNLLNNGAPSIPDDSLGWEVTAGVDWKLLEGLTLRARGAYWEPGKWFNYACVDKTIVSFIIPTTVFQATPLPTDGAAIGSSWGVNPDRSIDPIWAFQSYLVYDF
jgi:hypothetical protein